jgi:hypothetical protein
MFLKKQAINLCCAARGHAIAVWLRLVPHRPNALRPGATLLSQNQYKNLAEHGCW